MKGVDNNGNGVAGCAGDDLTEALPVALLVAKETGFEALLVALLVAKETGVEALPARMTKTDAEALPVVLFVAKMEESAEALPAKVRKTGVEALPARMRKTGVEALSVVLFVLVAKMWEPDAEAGNYSSLPTDFEAKAEEFLVLKAEGYPSPPTGLEEVVEGEELMMLTKLLAN